MKSERPAGAPDDAWNAFRNQRNSARTRGIPFLFDFETWWAWWQEEDRWLKRGRRADHLVMARRGDVGPYSPDNVICITLSENSSQKSDEGREALRATAAASNIEKPRAHLNTRGDGHPRSQAVITPAGRFGSAALAAEHHGIARQTAAYKARIFADGWCYEGTLAPIIETPEPVRLPYDHPQAPILTVKLSALLSALIEAEDDCRAKTKNPNNWCRPSDIWIDATIRTTANFDALRVLGLVIAHQMKPRLWCSTAAGRRQAQKLRQVVA